MVITAVRKTNGTHTAANILHTLLYQIHRFLPIKEKRRERENKKTKYSRRATLHFAAILFFSLVLPHKKSHNVCAFNFAKRGKKYK